eukprot:scaffold341_cov154-Ochromonas_danica.AAC.11
MVCTYSPFCLSDCTQHKEKERGEAAPQAAAEPGEGDASARPAGQSRGRARRAAEEALADSPDAQRDEAKSCFAEEGRDAQAGGLGAAGQGLRRAGEAHASRGWTEEVRRSLSPSPSLSHRLVTREAERQERERKSMLEYAQRMEEENERRRQAEEMIALLERQEKELLDRLRRSQQEQQEAYENLERSLRI